MSHTDPLEALLGGATVSARQIASKIAETDRTAKNVILALLVFWTCIVITLFVIIFVPLFSYFLARYIFNV